MKYNTIYQATIERIKERKVRSAWDKGVKVYAWGGCAEIYDGSIAERLCTPYELKRTCYGEKKPNNREEWLDTQARALEQAARIVRTEYRTLYTMR